MPQTEATDMQKSGGMKPPGNIHINRMSIVPGVGASPGNM